ncbi:MAG: hypothetical protein KGY81_06535, partial [Phycisphaerae bacterium]|nr:hypothetical protein [Phycisphaerae bacterium]
PGGTDDIAVAIDNTDIDDGLVLDQFAEEHVKRFVATLWQVRFSRYAEGAGELFGVDFVFANNQAADSTIVVKRTGEGYPHDNRREDHA